MSFVFPPPSPSPSPSWDAPSAFPYDLIHAGTPAGVAAIQSNDRLEGGIDGLETLTVVVIR